MTDANFPITPPPELIAKWAASMCGHYEAARWGADQELEACCEEMKSIPSPLGIPFGEMASNALRAARRPKPPSLKEQGLKALDSFEGFTGSLEEVDIIRRALESLPE